MELLEFASIYNNWQICLVGITKQSNLPVLMHKLSASTREQILQLPYLLFWVFPLLFLVAF